MKKSELFQNIDTLMTEVLELKKSWDDKMEKAEDKPSDAVDDAVHMADHGADEESLADYAKKLSDEELHELISSLVQEAEGRGGEGEEQSSEEPEASEKPEMEKAEEMPEAGESEEPEAGEEDESEDESEDSEEESGDLDSKVAELSDEEIKTLMSAIQAEMAKRGSAPAEKSYEKSEHDKEAGEKMEKSLKAALKKIDDLSAQIESFRKSQSKKVERKESMPTQKYADPKITVLEKSAQDDSKVVMTGATLANWLISEQAAGNKKVNSDLVTKANLSKSVEDASEFYKELERLGIKAPRS